MMVIGDEGVATAGRMEGAVHRLPVRIYYEDTDAGGVVYHANYLRYFERARSEMLRLAGAGEMAAPAPGSGGYVVAEATLRYLRPARLGDLLAIVSRVEQVRSAACHLVQEAWRNDELLVDGRLVIAFVGPDGRPRRQPRAWIEALAAHSRMSAGE